MYVCMYVCMYIIEWKNYKYYMYVYTYAHVGIYNINAYILSWALIKSCSFFYKKNALV
jgi:hypothetical protein